MKTRLYITAIAFFSIILIAASQDNEVNSTIADHSHSQERLNTLDREITKMQRDISRDILDVNDKVEELWWKKFFGIFAASAIAGGTLGFLITSFGFKAVADKKVIERINKFINSDDSAIKTLEHEVNSSKWKTVLRKEPILVLNNNNTVDQKNFNIATSAFEPHIESISDLKDALTFDFRKYEIVLLENYSENNSWNYKDPETVVQLEQLINLAVENDAFFFSYSNQFIPHTIQDNPKLKDHLNFAKSAPQLYSNLMNTLKFRYLKQKSTKS